MTEKDHCAEIDRTKKTRCPTQKRKVFTEGLTQQKTRKTYFSITDHPDIGGAFEVPLGSVLLKIAVRPATSLREAAALLIKETSLILGEGSFCTSNA